LVGNPDAKRPLGMPRSQWKDSMKMDIMEIRYNVVDWIYLPHGMEQWRTLLNTLTDFVVP
jgi:hypothetical protein